MTSKLKGATRAFLQYQAGREVWGIPSEKNARLGLYVALNELRPHFDPAGQAVIDDILREGE